VICRSATPEDRDSIREVCLAAFERDEATVVAKLAVEIVAESTTPPCITLVATEGGEVTGYAALSPVWLEDESLAGFILAPLCVAPAHQHSGVGATLVREGLKHCRLAGGKMAFVYGDPAYYGRFGFAVEVAQAYPAPHNLSMPFGWQAVSLLDASAPSPRSGKLSCIEPLDLPQLW
jgi:putative acetyltransferase